MIRAARMKSATAGDIGRHKIGRELNPRKAQTQDFDILTAAGNTHEDAGRGDPIGAPCSAAFHIFSDNPQPFAR
jgi:hypothetical protein